MAASTTVALDNAEALGRELVSARRETDSLFRLIDEDTLYSRPIADRHRLIFYLGHFEAFDFNLVARRSLGAPSFQREFDELFARGIDPEPGKAPADTPADWPSKPEVLCYVERTRAWIDDHIREADSWIVQMAIEHRHMHAETFAYLMHNLPHSAKQRPRTGVSHAASRSAPQNSLIQIEGGMATLGQPLDRFGWDNEHRAHDVFVPAFRMSQFKISNAEYLEFLHEGGPVPHFWHSENGQWFWRGMFENTPLPLDWPVWVTHEQASAYARWRGLELPSEAEYLRARALSAPDPQRDNFGYLRWDPIAVDACPEPDRPSQLTGNGWEWTRDEFAPFDGFDAHPFYPGYSADFFDGRHYVMKGASPRTAALLARPSFRNWFRPDYPYMYAGFRLVAREN